MNALELLETRRSIRKYTDQEVTDDEIRSVIREARYAPTWKNSQSVRFYAVKDRNTIDRLADECTMGFSWNEKLIKNAPAVIVEATVANRCGYERDGSFSTSKGTHWESFDAGGTAVTLCLAAHALGLGTCILGVFEEKKVKEVLELPENQKVSCLILIGHPAESPGMPKRKAVEELLKIV